jgi:polysaccharide biosynthesis protein PslG
MAARLRVAAMASSVAVASMTASLFIGQTSAASAATANTVGQSAGVSPGADLFSASDAQLATELNDIAATGAKYLRVDFAWSWVEGGGANSWDWSTTDRVVNAAVARGLTIDALATYAPSWATGQSSDKHAPLNGQDFYNFVYQAGLRYIPQGVTTWEMWNEPNISNFMSPPNPALYTTNILIPGSGGWVVELAVEACRCG